DRPVRVQRSHRVLEDHRDRAAADPAQLALGEPEQLAPVQLRGAGRAAVVREEPEQREHALALPGARLADDAERLAAIEIEREALDGVDVAVGGGEADVQVAYFEQWHFSPLRLWGCRALRGVRHLFSVGESKIQRRGRKEVSDTPFAQRSFGSSASRRPSPKKLKQNNVVARKTAGKSSIHGALSISSAPSFTSAPHDVIGSCTPSPRKLRNDSTRITCGIVSVT